MKDGAAPIISIHYREFDDGTRRLIVQRALPGPAPLGSVAESSEILDPDVDPLDAIRARLAEARRRLTKRAR